MLKYSDRALKSELYARIKLAPVNAIQRAIALNALRDAELVSNGIVWVMTAVRRLFAPTSVGTNELLHTH